MNSTLGALVVGCLLTTTLATPSQVFAQELELTHIC